MAEYLTVGDFREAAVPTPLGVGRNLYRILRDNAREFGIVCRVNDAFTGDYGFEFEVKSLRDLFRDAASLKRFRQLVGAPGVQLLQGMLKYELIKEETSVDDPNPYRICTVCAGLTELDDSGEPTCPECIEALHSDLAAGAED